MDREQLKAAIEADVISADQAARLEVMFGGDDRRLQEGEPLRFLSNLNDVFLSIGLVILFIGLGAALSILSFGQMSFERYLPFIMGPLAAVAWGLSEYFCARRRLLLPSIVLSIFWTVCVGMTVFSILVWNLLAENGTQLFSSVATGNEPEELFFSEVVLESRWASIVSILSASGAAFLYYLRFRLPFSQFLVVMTLSSVVLILAPAFTTLLVTGFACLFIAIFFDARDPHRATRLSDNAFWLHVAAAPQIVYGFRGLVEGNLGMEATAVHIALVSVLAGLAILSLALNRRALIISGLVTFGWAIWNLFQVFGDSIFMRFAGPLLLIGALIVLLGSGWKTARRILLVGMPTSGVVGRIFPKEV
ncbi:hypothetical protein [Ponticaulis sp.]|uniref:hypothetical protein n=1 Tax=Ponticaulis sp. TaxID=2020902 RepID=UPI000B735F5C|nr:hypothetical protein [Ponticaulis sp.]MAI91035.1 hypothetical protein [Ponticaulis sp.]OUX98370.1 MAG: hypothetical protein CBB65_11360 [Hyphomonadaceae bacterium TMED5]|tara:strand:- start:102723 stop:103811 length:1089 start_codon:yes stop_codon:yes gene_type:complete